MKKYIVGVWFSLPLQLLLLHVKRYQILLVFWYILFATVNGSFMQHYGAYALYLAPEYLGKVNFLSTAIVGIAFGVFIMSWNITTFILHGQYLRFLATTAQPFLKYCINNALLPLFFLFFYLFKAIAYEVNEEFFQVGEVLLLILGFVVGFILSILVAFGYFFGADKTIFYSYGSVIKQANYAHDYQVAYAKPDSHLKPIEMRVDWFLSARLQLRKPRNIHHYSEEFLHAIFKRHHLAAVFAIFLAFAFLIAIGFVSDKPLFQIPAAASITLFFAILIAASGGISLFLKSWTIPVLLVLYFVFNYLYEKEIYDPRNKVYGLTYSTKNERPLYNPATIHALCADSLVEKDKKAFLSRLKNWKDKQKDSLPAMIIINVSGGGTRSAYFSMQALQQIDSILGGSLMQKTVLINGASGGMLGATYYRQLFWQQQQNKEYAPIHRQDYAANIAKDLLNPLFSSMITRDIMGPVQKFSLGNQQYIKDRGFAFEQQLNHNTGGVLDISLQQVANAENDGTIPTMLFSSVISRDGRKLLIGTQPMRFLMKPPLNSTQKYSPDADAIDFQSYFVGQHPMNIRLTSALRMNATFPYVLPNVWLPTNPIIDVMDAGLRDNFGQETSLRFIQSFEPWIKENVSTILLIQIRDHSENDWDKPLESNSIASFITKPFLLLQNNWFKMQDYYQHDQLSAFLEQ
ncbi:MAG: hypothetical protein ACOVQE_01085, partial [Chitinophagaceae bacterium]